MKCSIAVIGLKGLPAFGGAATVGENIIEQLKNEYDFTVYSTSSHTHLKTGEYNGYKQIVFKKIPFKKLNTLYYYFLSVFHALLFGKYNLVHLHHRDAAFIIPILRLRYKVLLTIHGIGTSDLSNKWNKYKWFFKIQENVFIKFADQIVTVSKRDYLILRNNGYSNISYIPNGINQSAFNIIPNTEHYDLIFSAGRILSFKGCHLMLEALIMLNFTGSILIIGELIENTQYTDEIYSLSKNLNVTFKGLLRNKNELYSYIKTGKLFIFPSFVEAMSIMLLEAVACGIPVIASNIEANTDIFDSKELLFFENGNTNDLAKKIEFGLKNYNRMLEMANDALLKLKERYTWKSITGEYNLIFQNQLQK